MTVLTLITSVLNGMPYLPEAVESVGGAADAIEHLVIDAGSTDGSLAFLRKRADIRLLERPGLSLYGAWNLGLTAARGRFIGFLNADDLLGPGAISTVLSLLEKEDETDILYGNGEAFMQVAGGPLRYRYSDPEVTGPSLMTFLFGAPIINAKIFRRSLFDRVGGFEETFSIAADREFLLRLLLSPAKIAWQRSSALLYRYRIHSGSQTLAASPATRRRMAEEHRQMVAGLLARFAVDTKTRRGLCALGAREGLVAALCDAKEGRIVRMTRTLAALIRSDPIFLLRLPAAHAAIAQFRDTVCSDRSDLAAPERPYAYRA